MINPRFSGLVVSSSLRNLAAGDFLVLPANPRRILLSFQVTLTNSHTWWFGRPPTGLTPTNELTIVPYFPASGNNAPYSWSTSYQDHGSAMQQEFWISLPAGLCRVYISEVSINCPFSTRWAIEDETSLTTYRYLRYVMSPPPDNFLALSPNPRRVSFTVVNGQGGNTDLRADNSSLANRFAIHGPQNPWIPSNRGAYGPIVNGAIYVDRMAATGPQWSISETVLV